MSKKIHSTRLTNAEKKAAVKRAVASGQGAALSAAAALATIAAPQRLGTQTGSLINHVMSGSAMLAPEIGMGATILSWSDRRAATITVIDKNGKRIGVVEDVATRTDNNGMSDSQEYAYSPGTGNPRFFTLRKNGAWVAEGDSIKGQRILIGTRDHHHDFSF